ncbi:MAG TPA: hypothetical protein VG308_16015 [Stellaceae bacterium]|jgi:hypothetical protein|nr:hypothetical protein [Stellaceae bacterium]
MSDPGTSRQGSRGLYIAVAVLGVVVIGIVVYFWSGSSEGERIAGLDTLTWTRDVPTASFSKDGGIISVTTGTGKTDYQLEASPKVPAGTVVIDYKVRVTDGSIMIGVLSADRQKFVITEPIPAPGTYEKSFSVTTQEGGTLLLANNRPTDGVSHFTIEKLDLYKH